MEDNRNKDIVNGNDEKNEEKIKFGFKDLLAIMIAQFEILMPIAIGAVVVIGLVLLFLTKFWLRT